MTTDNFTEAAAAAAEEQWTRDLAPGQPLRGPRRMDRRIGFTMGAAWARTHLAAQEVTEEEVTEAALAMCRGDGAGTCWNYDDTVHGGCTDHTDDARAALSAARNARRDEEKR